MPIPEKDQKILWSRAAGRCSVCRVELTLETAQGGNVTLGQMCHIIAESEDGPRGQSPLVLADRNRYSNLILLCAHHHMIVDRDEQAYPVEVLHQIKTDWELFVRERFAEDSEPSLDEIVYSDLIDSIVVELRLDSWGWFIEHAITNLVHLDFTEARSRLNAKLLATIWPETKPDVSRAIQSVIRAFSDYIGHYETNVELGADQFLRPDKAYKRFFPNPNYHADAEAEERWSIRAFWLLCQFVVELNEFAEIVRAQINPRFFRIEGRFLLLDPLGTWFNGQSMMFVPDREEVEQRLAQLPVTHD